MTEVAANLKVMTKLVAAGNDFLFLESANGITSSLTREIVKAVCDRHFGIGADGLVVMQPQDESTTKWYFFNSDGSRAAMCGNAARAAAAWLKKAKAKFPHRLQTEFGTVILNSVTSGIYSAEVNYAQRPLRQQRLSSGGVLIDTGVPHAVFEVQHDVLKMTDRNQAVPYRWPTEAGPDGANVTFFRRASPDSIEAITFERGVEDYTLSCGTGVLAAATVASSDNWPEAGIEVRNPGGLLRVLAPNFPRSLILVGPAQAVFEVSHKIEL
jgi:diaminopimelate epimerase